MQFPPGTRFNQYEILSPLGKGGMGEVYLARDEKLERNVALKILPLEFTFKLDRLRRFEQEAKAVSALNHPNIITIHEISAVNNTHFITTEFIEGLTLRDHLAKEKLGLSAALEIAIQTATALTAAHAAHIIHRDIKPENIMLRKDGIVKVLDFGLAKLTEKKVKKGDWEIGRLGEEEATLPLSPPRPVSPSPLLSTEAGAVMGTAHYMSPEQARGEKVDARSDIFSLGVVLYEMVAGQRPFDGVNIFEQVAAVLDREPAPLIEARPELQRIVSKALRKDREQRYQHVNDLLLDLKDLKQELEIEAKLKGRTEVAPTVSLPPPATEQPETTPTISSTKIILGEIKRHKLGALIALGIVLAVAVASYFWQRTKTTEVAIDSIVVLPFANQNHAEETEYLADGLTESIINNLTQLPDLRVIARNSAFRYKGKETDLLGAGQTLGVRAVVVGRVLQRGENLMVSAELVDVRENKQLWGQQYNRKLADVFAVQEEIAREISEKLRLKLSGGTQQQLTKHPTENLKAFQYYMQGRTYAQRRTREDLLEAIRYCEKAIAEDRNYALAYAGLTDPYANLGARGYIAPIEGRRKAEEAARKALALDANLAEAHAALGQANVMFAPYNFLLSDRELRRAIELSPSLASAHNYLGGSLVRQGHFDEALKEFLKARELDPLSSTIARQVALPYYLKRDYVRALELLRQADELGPALTTTWEIGVYVQNRLFNEALAELEKAKRERKGDPILIYDTGMVYAAQGKRAEAIQIIKELEAMSGASLSQANYIPKIYATLNEKELALTWLERGLAEGAIGAFYKDEPVWNTIRSDARFGDLLRRMGVPQ